MDTAAPGQWPKSPGNQQAISFVWWA